MFRLSERGSAAELSPYIERIFFDSPLADPGLPSYVGEDAEGRVVGFLGIVPRLLSFRGTPIRAAVATQLMVAPEARGVMGRRLLRALIDGPQDLILSDAANDAARRLFERFGGRVAFAQSLCWTRVLRPVRFLLSRSAATAPHRLSALAARPACAMMDGALARRSLDGDARANGDVAEPMTAPRQLAEMDAVLRRWPLRPLYREETLAWMLGEIAQKRDCGAMEQVLVRDASGEMLGWFFFCPNPGGVAQVVQLATRKDAFARVFAHLVRRAAASGATALSGRLDPAVMHEFAAAGCSFTHEGPWTLYHSRHADIADAVERGEAFLSRVEGEWWLSF